MAEPLKISTSKYLKQGKVDVDGHIWGVVLPGAGTEMRFSQASRAAKLAQAMLDFLDKKIEDGTVTESELASYEEYNKKYEASERVLYDILVQTFSDETKDNSDVKKWVDETPTAIIMQCFDDIRLQANEKNEAANGKKETS